MTWWGVDGDMLEPVSEFWQSAVQVWIYVGEKGERGLVAHEHCPFGCRTLWVGVDEQGACSHPETSSQVNRCRCFPRPSLEIGDCKTHRENTQYKWSADMQTSVSL